jgi:hypothetical protein
MRILLLDRIAFQCGGPCPTEKSVRVVTITITSAIIKGWPIGSSTVWPPREVRGAFVGVRGLAAY